MTEAALPALLFSVLAASTTLAGILLIAFRARWVEGRLGVFAGFAAGVLITVALVHLAPEAALLSGHAPWLTAAGFAFGFGLNRLMHAGRLSDDAGRQAVRLGVVGIALHSLMDGFSYVVTFAAGTTTGVLTAVSLILHEAPEGIVTFALLHGAGLSRIKAGLGALAAAGLTTPLGAALAIPLLGSLTGHGMGDVLAFVAGLLLYVGAGHLLPHAERASAWWALGAVVLGAGVAALALSTATHDHGLPGEAHGGAHIGHEH